MERDCICSRRTKICASLLLVTWACSQQLDAPGVPCHGASPTSGQRRWVEPSPAPVSCFLICYQPEITAGFERCQAIRRWTHISVIFLSESHLATSSNQGEKVSRFTVGRTVLGVYGSEGRRWDILGTILESCLHCTPPRNESNLWALNAFCRIPWTTQIPFCPSLPLSRVIVLLLSTFPQGSISWNNSQMCPNADWVPSHQSSEAPAAQSSILGDPWPVNNPCCQTQGDTLLIFSESDDEY